MAQNRAPKLPPLRIRAVRRSRVPKRREGKYETIIDLLLRRIDRLSPGAALKVPLAGLPTTMANIRAALNRATRKRALAVATSSDPENLYIWKTAGKS